MIPASHAHRVDRLRAAMRAAGAEVFLCDHAEMLHWLTGYTVSETFYRGCILPLEGDPVWVLRAIDEVPCRAATWVPRVVTYPDHADPHVAMAEALAGFGATRIGADFTSFGFTAWTRDRLSQLLPGAQFVDLNAISNTIRNVKDAAEIALIAEAAAIGDGAMAAIAAGIAPGMRARDASAIGAQHYLTQGADDYWVGPISIARQARAAQGHGMGFLHATFTEDRLSEGDILHVELVPRVRFYSARFMRSISLGTPSAEDREVMARMVSLQDAQFAAIRPGEEARAADALLREGMLREGLRDEYPNITGYALGIYAKTPRSSETVISLHPGATWRFEAGQVLHLYTTAKGLALSETVEVTETGCRRLTTTAREILVAGA
ncbi:aminopeptidase P family N-terminal domain-containing protein [Pseudooceanicola sp. CBS1P-1]|uniref:M24 family metallopeptidase n=1 Tax=Pseudooceanicola albus TaxID=2692189 RepID=A0A6L7FZ07_9RHOB|nr:MULTISPECIES: M24 family metallopeptidase [Pseudooceanicola]MBT9383161.1 aminopeptidase P family N-terminal domain-containing protein [Pseudooceanicola endophyticus]MXN16516.1 M24 family metallopeptidase [Pseudooceanicola albus]